MIVALRAAALAATGMLVVGGMTSVVSAAQEESLRAFASWQGQGQIMRTGQNEASFVGTLSGRFYVDTDQGPVDAGNLTCPIVIYVDLDKNTQKASGRCTIAVQADNRLYMSVSCDGLPLVGCTGESKVTGGTGAFANATGSGHFVVRTSSHELKKKADLTMDAFGAGIIYWPALHYRIP